MIHYPRGEMSHPVVEEPEYLTQQQKCSLLADVGSQMAKDWQEAGEPGNKNSQSFAWTPKSLCDIDNEPDQTAKTIYGAQFENFNIDYNLIWNSFSTLIGIGKNVGPAAFTAIEKGHPHTAYLCFRGTLNLADIGIDGKALKVNNPITGESAVGGLCHQGFSEYFTGCGINSTKGNTPGARPHGNVPGDGVTLYERLVHLATKQSVKHLVVTGHSLGSAVGTLASALANTIDNDGAPLFKTVRGSVSASPRVGNEGFKKWFDALQDGEGNDLGHRFWRLRNESDGVPDLPSREMGYTEVGYDVTFNANYPAEIAPDKMVANYNTPNGYEIKKKGNTNWTDLGASSDAPGTKFVYNGVTPTGDNPGSVIIPGWQANPNHNPCCCYSYAVNNPFLTTNPHLNAGNEEYGGSCHFPVVPPRKTSGGNP